MTSTETRLPSPPRSPKPKRLTRSRTDRMIAGVCGGFAEYAGVDVNLIRLAMVALALIGPGLVLYVVAWLVVPEGEF
jgi:phage shock protein PspC (stress-responsive transcriptional regulator)